MMQAREGWTLGEEWQASMQAQHAQLSALGDAVSSILQVLEGRMAERFCVVREYPIGPKGVVSVDIPKGAGGLLIIPRNGLDLSNISPRIYGIKTTIPASTTTPYFVPLLGTASSGSLTNTSAAEVFVAVATMSPDYAILFA